LAKIASDANKPNGQLLVDPSGVLDFVHALPVRKIPGIGRVTEKLLQQACHIHTVQELHQQRGLVQWLFKPMTAQFLLRASVGCSGSGFTEGAFGSTRTTEPENADDPSTEHQKGMSRERTFGDEHSWTALNSKLEDIARMVSKDMQRKSVLAHTITVKVKLDTFDVLCKSQSLPRGVYIQAPEELVAMASKLLAQLRAQHNNNNDNNQSHKSFCSRLLGIRCSNLMAQEELSIPQKEQGTLQKFLNTTVKDSSTTTPLSSTATTASASPYQSNTSKSKKAPPEVTKAAMAASCTTTSSQRTLVYPSLLSWQKKENGNIDSNDERENAALNNNQKKTMIPLASATPKVEEECVECPLCRYQILATDNEALNRHIDTCLNASTVRQAVKEASQQPMATMQQPKKRQRLADFWSNTPEC
jgi:DNA polymerase kappa